MKSISKPITCLMCFMLVVLTLVGCQTKEEMKLYYEEVNEIFYKNSKLPI